jgi:hypothetical protein
MRRRRSSPLLANIPDIGVVTPPPPAGAPLAGSPRAILKDFLADTGDP